MRNLTPLKFNSSSLKNDGWKTIRLPFGMSKLSGDAAKHASREYQKFSVFPSTSCFLDPFFRGVLRQ